MKRKLFSLVYFFIIILAFAVAASAQRVGGFKDIAKDDPRAVEAADFAVVKRTETNSEQEGLKLDSIDKAAIQIVAGVNIKLCMTVTLGDEEQTVSAVVYKNLKGEFSLTSWQPVESCGEQSVGSSGPSISAKAAACDKLKLSAGDEDADMGGKRYLNFTFTNNASEPCTLKGFPTVVVLNKLGKPIRSIPVSYNNDYPNGATEGKRKPVAVTIEPGKTAGFQIYYNDGMALDHKKPYAKAFKFLITAPRGDKAFGVKTDIQPCCGVQVSSIRTGSQE